MSPVEQQNDSLSSLEERIQRAVQLVARLRQEREAAVQEAADPSLLGEDHGPRLVDEAAHPLQVALPAERRPALPLLREDPVQDELGGDAGMVETREEQRRAAEHAGVADHEVLHRGALRMPEVEAARDVGRWLDEDEGLE